MFTDVNLGQAGPSGYDLSVFNTGPTQFSASNSGTTFEGNMGLANGSTTNVSGGGTLTGNLYVDPGATLQANFSSQFNVDGSIINVSLAQAVTDAQNASTNAGMLTADQTYTSVGGSALTISPTGALNILGGHDTVVSIDTINITNPSNNLTFSGGANDYYIVNVGTSISVSNGAITTSGGIPNSHLLFAVHGTSASKEVVLTNSSSSLAGTYLAPFANQLINLAPGTVYGSIMGYQIQTSSGPTVAGSIYTAPPVPEPATTLVVVAFVVAGLLSRRRFGNTVARGGD